MMSRSLPSHDPKMEFAKLQGGLKVVVTFIDCFSVLRQLSSIFAARSADSKRQEAGARCVRAPSSTVLLHHLQSMYLQGSRRIELKWENSFIQSSNLSWQFRNKERRKQKLKNEMRCVIQTRLKKLFFSMLGKVVPYYKLKGVLKIPFLFTFL